MGREIESVDPKLLTTLINGGFGAGDCDRSARFKGTR